MKKRILVAAPAATSALLTRFLASSGHEVLELSRHETSTHRDLSLDDRAVYLAQRDLTTTLDAAVILDSGYPWSIPTINPTADEWCQQREHFDDYLRAQRERDALWLSVLELLNGSVPCMNPQSAFAHQALKVSALDLLFSHGLPVADFVATNNPEQLRAFCEAQQCCFSLGLGSTQRPEPFNCKNLTELDLSHGALLIAGLPIPTVHRAVFVNGTWIAEDASVERDQEAMGLARRASTLLEAPALELTLGRDRNDWTVLDFCVSMPLETYPDEVAECAMSAIEAWAVAQGHQR